MTLFISAFAFGFKMLKPKIETKSSVLGSSQTLYFVKIGGGTSEFQDSREFKERPYTFQLFFNELLLLFEIIMQRS